MADKKRIFISSVQKELELERAAVASLITTDPFLLQHCVPVLFENEPPAPRPARQACLEALYDTIRRDLLGLVELGLLEPQGKGRNARYTPKGIR
jgi:hypothetical protein